MSDIIKWLNLSTQKLRLECKCARLQCFKNTSKTERNLIFKKFNEINKR